MHVEYHIGHKDIGDCLGQIDSEFDALSFVHDRDMLSHVHFIFAYDDLASYMSCMIIPSCSIVYLARGGRTMPSIMSCQYDRSSSAGMSGSFLADVEVALDDFLYTCIR